MTSLSEGRRPKLLFLAPYFAPACYGGVVQVYLGLLERLRGFDVTVLADHQQSTVEQTDQWDAWAARELKLRVRRLHAFELHLSRPHSGLGSLVSPWLNGASTLRFFCDGRRSWKSLIRHLQPDLVVCGGTYSAGWLTVSLPRSVPLINYIHGEELTMEMRSRFLTRYMRRVQMRSIRRAALNITVSEYSAKLTQTLADVDASKVTILPNFVDTKRFYPSQQREMLRLRRGWTKSCILLTIARLERRKGIDHALRALALLRDQGRIADDWTYVIAGRGEQQQSLEMLVQPLKLTDYVSFFGFVPESDLAKLYQAADMFVQPNREINGDTEGFGIVFLEASACGLPVVGGTAGGTAEAIEDGVSGYRVDGESVDAIASAMERLMTDAALRAKRGRQGAARVLSHFRVEHAAARFEELLHGVLADARGSARTVR